MYYSSSSSLPMCDREHPKQKCGPAYVHNINCDSGKKPCLPQFRFKQFSQFHVCVWSPTVDWVFGIFHWLSPYADDTLMLRYRTGIGRVELRNTTQFDTQTQNRMKNIWVFLIFNVLSTFRSDTPKANCQNKKMKRAGKMLSASVRSHFGGLSDRIPQKLNVEVILW